MQSTSLPAPTKAERERFSYFPQIGCVACLCRSIFSVPETHHLNLGSHAGQKRISHAATVALCCWHHRGVPPTDRHGRSLPEDVCRELYGPSMAKEPREFHDCFGDDAELLAATDALYLAHRRQRVDVV